jgi:glycosyltransferase involved in cell wall biosynthesis
VWGAAATPLRTALRQWLGPLTLPAAARQLCHLITDVRPDLVHAMRIPYEGMTAAMADLPAPLIVSVWGNDFTLHGPSNPMMAHYTRRTLKRLDVLHADCHRDVRLALEWGLPPQRRTFVLPGAGGVQAEMFYPPPEIVSTPLVIQPRGVRAYVKNDIFFQAVPLVLKECPHARFICPNMAGEQQAQRWVGELGVTASVDLLPEQTRAQMAGLFRRSSVIVSPTVHDGTPNTLLEAMACGCFPVAGDLESLREWITTGENGLLVDLQTPQARPEALAQAILRALGDEDLRRRAREINLAQIAERADHARVMAQAEEIYASLL